MNFRAVILLLGRSMLKTAAQQASRSKWKWTGHVTRLHHTRWAQATTMWDPYRGRPSTIWADYFNKIVGPHWSKVARDRNEWKVNTFKYHVFAPMGRFQLESIYLYFPPSSQLLHLCFCPGQKHKCNSWDDGGK